MHKNILVTGGAGYTGTALVKLLLENNFSVKVIDLFMYGEDCLPDHPNLQKYKMDIRDNGISELIKGVDVVVHLAGISNRPGFGVSYDTGFDINVNAVRKLVELSKSSGVKRFIYPSSCSVYGVSNGVADEDSPLNPLNDYARFKALSEEIITGNRSNDFHGVIIRPATVCGLSARQRFDLIVNSMINQAYHYGEIHISDPSRIRPTVHIDDLARLYMVLINESEAAVSGQIYNVAYENRTIKETALLIAKTMGNVNVLENSKSSNEQDNRSYTVSSDKLKRTFNFENLFSVEKAVKSLTFALENHIYNNTFDDTRYYNDRRQPLFLS